nr:metallophosphoesterase [Kofleriaceae bacterium]
MRLAVAALVGVVACHGGDDAGDDAPSAPLVVAAPTAPATTTLAPAMPPKKPSWSFVVLSDLHLPNPKREVIDHILTAIIAMSPRPRFVILAGDHTNGNPWNPPALVAGSIYWWKVVAAALQPLRDAHIPVLPVAGNHDSYLPGQRAHYAATFDLKAWAAPFEVHGAVARGEIGAPPFSYGVDVDDVHFSFVHNVQEWLDKDVASWLADDLADASKARIRIVVSHAPWHTVIAHERTQFAAQMGGILEGGNANLYLSGHEHLFWDEDFALPHGHTLRQVMTGCVSGWYNYGPNKDELAAAHCTKIVVPGKVAPLACAMPHGGGAFMLALDHHNREIEHARIELTVITVPPDGTAVEATPMTLDATNKLVPWYLGAEPHADQRGDSQRGSSGSTR